MITKIIKFRIVVFLYLISIYPPTLYSQNLYSVSSTPSCEGLSNGTIAIDIDPNEVEPGWSLPYEVSYVHLNTGDVEDVIMTTYAITLENLAAGDYEIEIDLSETCDIEIEETVSEIPKVELDHKILLPVLGVV